MTATVYAMWGIICGVVRNTVDRLRRSRTVVCQRGAVAIQTIIVVGIMVALAAGVGAVLVRLSQDAETRAVSAINVVDMSTVAITRTT